MAPEYSPSGFTLLLKYKINEARDRAFEIIVMEETLSFSKLGLRIKNSKLVLKGFGSNANDTSCSKTTSPEAVAAAMAAHVFPLI